MVGELVDNPWLMGLLMAGVLAAIMSSLDSQFACLGTMFTNDIVIPIKGKDYYSDADKVKLARYFVVGVVAVAYVLSLLLANSSVFNLGVWCFSGFTALFTVLETCDSGGCVRMYRGDNCALVLLVPTIRLGFRQGLQRARDVAGGTLDTGLDDSVDRRLTAESPTGESIDQQIFPARIQ
jgi:hypothetical protein